ncbi:MAG: 4-hydroxy-tetrahydrodipicolinate synthase [Alistipes sp.]|nr:4-hydroxy-tetrahydrodipicolinate synthase [Alistipes sp.]
MLHEKIKGVGVALITPFKNYEVDYDALERMVDYVIAGGVDYIVALGTTAETPTLSTAERNKVLRYIVAKCAERVPIVAGVGGNSTHDTVELLRNFDLSGVVAILSVVPYYNKPTQEGIYRHFMAIAEASPLPVIIYNVPGRTGVNMSAQTSLRLAHASKNIIAIKEASGNIEQMQEIIDGRPDNFLVLSGDDALTVELIKRGGEGVISVAANCFPEMFCDCIHKAMAGSIAEAEQQMERLTRPINLLFKEGNPTGAKAMCADMGLITNELRLPLVSSSDTLTQEIKDSISELSLR